MVAISVSNMAVLQQVKDFLDVRMVLLGLFFLLVLRWLISRPKNLPPGPWGFPVLGSIPAIAWAMCRGLEPHHLFEEYAAKYGPVFCLNIFNKRVVVLNEYALVKEAFQHPQLSDRPKNVITEVTKTEGVVFSSGEVWMELRRFCLTVLRSFGVGKTSFEEQIGIEAEELMKEMAAFKGEPFNPKPLLGNAVANVICSVIFGKRYAYTDREFAHLLDLLSRNLKLAGGGGITLIFPSMRHLPFFPTSELFLNLKVSRSFIKNIIDSHRKTFDADNLKDFTDAFLMEIRHNQARNTGRGHPEDGKPKTSKYSHLSERNIVGTISNLFAAGSETTATTLQWCILYMMLHPDVQTRVQAEIDDVVGRYRLPRMADVPELNFTRAVIWEVQRLANIVPLGVPHCAASDIILRGFLIPKGSVLMSNFWKMSRDPKVWPDPEQFIPERFLNVKGEATRAEELIPFSIGRRSCIGEHLAKMELFLFFSFFVHQFTFKKPDDSPPLSLSLKGRGGVTRSPLPFDTCAVLRA
ncbi:cytochrome P450 2J6-like [Acanthaster planci]|uniref:Cytochrome P450 2J6-like n=1 Tax=Acanthaster planci TaxID=133434 RepID=A0A8B7XK16_ACAPL|nr:cytochrome P450 2J6-like [Acanthaster planci]